MALGSSLDHNQPCLRSHPDLNSKWCFRVVEINMSVQGKITEPHNQPDLARCLSTLRKLSIIQSARLPGNSAKL
jgi:hypothetical protein